MNVTLFLLQIEKSLALNEYLIKKLEEKNSLKNKIEILKIEAELIEVKGVLNEIKEKYKEIRQELILQKLNERNN